VLLGIWRSVITNAGVTIAPIVLGVFINPDGIILIHRSDRVMAKRSNISDFLGLHKSTVGMLFMVVLVGMGERMAERFLPIYLIALGGGVISIGLLNVLDSLLSALYAFPGGYLSDRMGTKKALLVFNIIAMFG